MTTIGLPCRQHRPPQLLTWGATVIVCCAALGLWIWSAAAPVPWWVDYLIAVLPLCATLFLIRLAYPSGDRYLFSTGFWISTTIVFYILLKSFDLILHDVEFDGINLAIWSVTIFTFPYVVLYKRYQVTLRQRAVVARTDAFIPASSRVWLLVVFSAFKLFGVFLAAGTSGDVLEVAAATQNNGAAYLYKIPLAANAIFLLILFDTFRNNANRGTALVATTIFLVEAIVTTNRLAIVMAVLWGVFLYHRYRKPFRLRTVALIGVPLVFIVVLFGYARNIEVGSFDAYLQAIAALSDNPVLLSDLFMGRLDMLPEMVKGIELYQTNALPSLNGGSYVYMFLHAVPRNVWESKPLLTAALVTSQTHPGAFADGVNIFPSIVVESLLNFGWAGIVIVGAVLGWLAAWYENALYSDRAIPTTWALSLLTFPMGLFNEGFHSNFSANVLYLTVLMFVIFKCLVWFGIIKMRRTV